MSELSADFDHDAANLPKHDDAPGIASDSKAHAEGEHTMASDDAAHTDAPGASSGHTPSSNIMILWPERRHFSDQADAAEQASEPQPVRSAMRRRRRMVLAGVAAISLLCGAAGGSLATFAISGLSQPRVVAAAPAAVDADASARLRDAIAHVTADLSALRTDFDRAGHARTAQVTKLNDRLDKLEKTQDEANTRLTKVSEAQDKLQEKSQDRMRQTSAAPAADVTGSITPAGAKGDLKLDPRKQIVDGWTLTQVTNGGAIVNGPGGPYEAFPGDPLPGVGRVEGVRYIDGRWAVITPKGLIIRR